VFDKPHFLSAKERETISRSQRGGAVAGTSPGKEEKGTHDKNYGRPKEKPSEGVRSPKKDRTTTAGLLLLKGEGEGVLGAKRAAICTFSKGGRGESSTQGEKQLLSLQKRQRL